jgi:sulfate adenylyltransferase (ADP) / ATP adenylyltransferase
LLEEDDLAVTYECLKEWEKDTAGGERKDKKLFAFFNSGAESGASQPHRHLQFLPVESVKGDEDGWELLIDRIERDPFSGTSKFF